MTHAEKMAEALRASEGADAAAEFEKTLPLSRSADFNRKYQWAQKMCAYLEAQFPADQLPRLRMGASCQPNDAYLQKVRALYLAAPSLPAFCDAYNAVYAGKHSLRPDGDSLLFSYPECYCSMVKRVNAPLSKTWCLCTLGYAKKLFDFALGCETKVELLESVKMGDERCTMRITRG